MNIEFELYFHLGWAASDYIVLNFIHFMLLLQYTCNCFISCCWSSSIKQIVRLLANHPQFYITLMTADRKAGRSFGSVFPHLITQVKFLISFSIFYDFVCWNNVLVWWSFSSIWDLRYKLTLENILLNHNIPSNSILWSFWKLSINFYNFIMLNVLVFVIITMHACKRPDNITKR